MRATNAANPNTVFAPLTGASNPLTLLTWNTWFSNDTVTIAIRQRIAQNEPLTGRRLQQDDHVHAVDARSRKEQTRRAAASNRRGPPVPRYLNSASRGPKTRMVRMPRSEKPRSVTR